MISSYRKKKKEFRNIYICLNEKITLVISRKERRISSFRMFMHFSGLSQGLRKLVAAVAMGTPAVASWIAFEFTALAKGFDDSSFHSKFDPVKGYKPDDVLKEKRRGKISHHLMIYIHRKKKNTYPNPNDSNPSTRNGFNLSETPVTKSCDDI